MNSRNDIVIITAPVPECYVVVTCEIKGKIILK